jgi:hypothetical protein
VGWLVAFSEGEKMSCTKKLFGGRTDDFETVRIGNQVWMAQNFVSQEGTAKADPEWASLARPQRLLMGLAQTVAAASRREVSAMGRARTP